MRIHRSLVFRLTAFYCLIFAVSVSALFAVVWVVTSRTMTNQIATEVQREAVALADEYRATDAATAAASIERKLRREACHTIYCRTQMLLRIAQIESGSRKAGFVCVDLSELFELVETTFQPVAEDTGHRLLSRIEPGAAITGDRELLLQLMTNLVENAIHHTPPGSAIELSLRQEGDEVLAAASDDGPGIPPRGARKSVPPLLSARG